jgi:hypothetical protein
MLNINKQIEFVCDAFLKRKSVKINNLTVIGDEIISYEMVIFKRKDNLIFVTSEKYPSKTTTKQINSITKFIKSKGNPVI